MDTITTHCHICGYVINSTYADTCEKCAADPQAAYDEVQAADRQQMESVDHALNQTAPTETGPAGWSPEDYDGPEDFARSVVDCARCDGAGQLEWETSLGSIGSTELGPCPECNGCGVAR